MTENSQDRWCVSLAAGWGPHQLPQKRSLALVSILQSLAAAKIANALHLRDFRSPAIFEFFNTIDPERTFSDSLFDDLVSAACGSPVMRTPPGANASSTKASLWVWHWGASARPKG